MTGRGLASTQQGPCLSSEGTDGLFQCSYLATTSHSQTRIHKNLLTFHPRPAGTPLSRSELLQTVPNCLQHPPKGCCSSWGLPEFTDCLSSLLASLSYIPRVFPMEGTARGCCRDQAPEAQGCWGILSCKAMDASQGSGSALLLSDRDSSNTHTLLSLKESCHVLDNPKLSARRNSGKHFLQMTRCCELYLGFKNSMSSSFPQNAQMSICAAQGVKSSCIFREQSYMSAHPRILETLLAASISKGWVHTVL